MLVKFCSASCLRISEILKCYLVFVAVIMGRESFILWETFRLPILGRKSIFKVQSCRLCHQLERSKSHTCVLLKAVFSSQNLFVFNNKTKKIKSQLKTEVRSQRREGRKIHLFSKAPYLHFLIKAQLQKSQIAAFPMPCFILWCDANW